MRDDGGGTDDRPKQATTDEGKGRWLRDRHLGLVGFLILFAFSLYGIWQATEAANEAQRTADAVAAQNEELEEQNAALEEQAEAIQSESQERTAANREILRTLCNQQQFTYRIFRGFLAADIREARTLIRSDAEVIGFTDGELRRGIVEARQVRGRLRPIDCETFARQLDVDAVALAFVPLVADAPAIPDRPATGQPSSERTAGGGNPPVTGGGGPGPGNGGGNGGNPPPPPPDGGGGSPGQGPGGDGPPGQTGRNPGQGGGPPPGQAKKAQAKAPKVKGPKCADPPC